MDLEIARENFAVASNDWSLTMDARIVVYDWAIKDGRYMIERKDFEQIDWWWDNRCRRPKYNGDWWWY